MYESFFDISVSLCNQFPAIDPFLIRRIPAHEVFRLFRRTANYSRRMAREKQRTKNGSVLRRPAGDTWF